MSTEPSAQPPSPPASVATAPTGILERTCEWDGCAPLTGRQKRFATEACKNAWHDLHRPRIASPVVGHPREGTIKAAVLVELFDYEWHSYHDIATAVKADKHSVVTRVSQLRALGFAIETDLPNGNSRRPHRVRLRRVSVCGHVDGEHDARG